MSSAVTVSVRQGLGIAAMLVRKGQTATLAQRVRERLGLATPSGPYRTTQGELALLGTGRGAWLATCEGGGNAFAASLRQAVGDLAAVSDHTDGYVVLRVSGPTARETLAKMIPIDLHPQAFGPGAVAVTAAGHMRVTIWRLNEATEGTATFEMAVYRSLAADFMHFLTESAA